MRIIDEDGNTISDPDLEKGQLVNSIVIKENAVPIDNETKFAWDDDDYEEVLVYILTSEKELIERSISEIKAKLSDTDKDVLQATETLIVSLTSAKTLSGLFNAIKEVYSDIEQVLSERSAWRDEINDLEAQLTNRERFYHE